LAPLGGGREPYYAIFREEPDAADEAGLRQFLAEFDRQLGEENIEYAAKRESGRLGPVRAVVIAAGTWAKWDHDRLAATGGSPEQYKHPCLIGDLKFRETMPVLREVGGPPRRAPRAGRGCPGFAVPLSSHSVWGTLPHAASAPHGRRHANPTPRAPCSVPAARRLHPLQLPRARAICQESTGRAARRPRQHHSRPALAAGDGRR